VWRAAGGRVAADVAWRINDALEASEVENPWLANVLPRIYARAPLSGELMGSLVRTIAKIGRRVTCSGARTTT
jgi:hypothetical protein